MPDGTKARSRTPQTHTRHPGYHGGILRCAGGARGIYAHRYRIAADLDVCRNQVLATRETLAALRELSSAIRATEWDLPPAGLPGADGAQSHVLSAYRYHVSDLASALDRAKGSLGGNAAWRRQFEDLCALGSAQVDACDALLLGRLKPGYEAVDDAARSAAGASKTAAEFHRRAADVEREGLRLAHVWEEQAAWLSMHQRQNVAIAAIVEDLILAVSYFPRSQAVHPRCGNSPTKFARASRSIACWPITQPT